MALNEALTVANVEFYNQLKAELLRLEIEFEDTHEKMSDDRETLLDIQTTLEKLQEELGTWISDCVRYTNVLGEL